MTASSYMFPGKLHSPQLNVKILARTRLYTQIDKSLARNLTTFVVPTGIGKTVLLAIDTLVASQILPYLSSTGAWIQQGGSDNTKITLIPIQLGGRVHV
jgi:ATP/maltotriose-dependent transcriptional regulator MalT